MGVTEAGSGRGRGQDIIKRLRSRNSYRKMYIRIWRDTQPAFSPRCGDTLAASVPMAIREAALGKNEEGDELFEERREDTVEERGGIQRRDRD